MRPVVVLGLVIALLAGPVSLALAAHPREGSPGPGPIQESVSMITRIDRAASLVVIRLDGGSTRRLLVNGTTAGDALAALGPGDLVSERCTMISADTAEALLIRLVRPAWMELSSFEQ